MENYIPQILCKKHEYNLMQNSITSCGRILRGNTYPLYGTEGEITLRKSGPQGSLPTVSVSAMIDLTRAALAVHVVLARFRALVVGRNTCCSPSTNLPLTAADSLNLADKLSMRW